MKLKRFGKTQRKRLKLSSKRPRKKNPRRLRNKLKKIMLIMIPVSLVISAVCLIIIFFLIGNDKTPGIISPLAQTVGQNTGSVNSGENKIRDFLEKEKITFKNLIFIDSSYFKIILDDDREILISAGGDIRKELSSLQYILSRLTMEGREFARLDLRYEKPIIIFK